MLDIPVRVRVQRDSIVRIKRYILGKGIISVSKGAHVSPEDVLGTSQISAGFRVIDLATSLNVPVKEVGKYLKKKLGDRIFKGELLAQAIGILGKKKNITAPEDSILEYLNPSTGELKLTFFSKKVDLPSGVFGIVEEVDFLKGRVVIKTQATIIHGMFGTGRQRDGILHIVGRRDRLMDKSIASHEFHGKILVAGSLIFKDAISACISDGVAGIITGGINARDYKGMAGGRLIFPKKLETDVGISIVVCEGFGFIPIGVDIFDILSLSNGGFAIIDGNSGRIILPTFNANCMNKIKSTVLPPIQENASLIYDKYQDNIAIKKGLKVRIIGNSYTGEQGVVVAIDKAETVLQSKIKTHMVTVETLRRKLQVPVANLEVIDYSF